MIQKRFKIGIGKIKIDSIAKRNILKVLESSHLSYGNFSREFESKMAKSGALEVTDYTIEVFNKFFLSLG